MSLYKVPFDFTHEEKVFGGYLSLRQMLYIVFSVLSIGILFLRIAFMFKMVLFLLIFGCLMTFAFLKIGSSYADKYFIDIVKYIFKKKIFIFER